MAGFKRPKTQFFRVMAAVSACLLWTAPAIGALAATDGGSLRSTEQKSQLVRQSVAFYEQKETVKSREGFEQALTEAPDNFAVPYYLGLIYLEQGDIQGAITQWQAYLRMDPDSDSAHHIRKSITLLLRKQAREFAQQAVANETDILDGPVADNTLAVTNFINLGSEQINPLGKGMAAMLITDLSHVPDLQVVDRIKLNALLEEMRLGSTGLVNSQTAPRIGRLLRARHVTSGSMADLINERLIIASAVMDTHQSISIGAQEAKGTLNRFFELEKQIACQIVRALNKECAMMPTGFNKIHTKSMPALLAYSQGLDYFDEEAYDQARDMFQQALDHDPRFELAATALLTTPTAAMKPMDTSQIVSSAASNGPSVAAAAVATVSPSMAAGTVGLSPMSGIIGGAVLVGGGVALAGGGGGSGGEGNPAPAGVLNLTGDWRGTWIDTAGTVGEASISLTQKDKAVTGTVSLAGDDCLKNGNISGTVSGATVLLTIQSGTETVEVKARADARAKTLNGTWNYAVSGLGCTDESGQFKTTLTTGDANVHW